MVLESTLGMTDDEIIMSGLRGTNQGEQLKATEGWNGEIDGHEWLQHKRFFRTARRLQI